MPKFKRNNNGDFVLSKSSAVSLGVVVLIIAAVTACVGYAVAQGHVMESHVADSNIHWSQTVLDEQYMPRRETDVHLRAIYDELRKINYKLDAIEH